MIGLKPRTLSQCSTTSTPGGRHGSKLLAAVITIAIALIATFGESVNGQVNRYHQVPASPSISAEVRDRWMAYLKTRTSTASPALRTPPNKDNQLVAKGGIECKTSGMFGSKTNPRMYHLCAKSRDNWYVFHYYCPQGSEFNDSTRKCVRNQVASGVTSPIRYRFPTAAAPPRVTTPAPTTRAPTTKKTKPRRKATRRSTTATTTTTTSTTTTTEAPLPEPEPAPPTDEPNYSEEEATEVAGVKNVVLLMPSMMDSESTAEEEDDDANEEVTTENEAADEDANLVDTKPNPSVPQTPAEPTKVGVNKTKKVMVPQVVTTSIYSQESPSVPAAATQAGRPTKPKKWRARRAIHTHPRIEKMNI